MFLDFFFYDERSTVKNDIVIFYGSFFVFGVLHELRLDFII